MANQIDNLTNFADQVTLVQLPDATTVSLELIFNGTTERWTMNVIYGDLTIDGINLCCLPNVLRQWRNIIPFGLACVTDNQTDPFDINDFSSGRVALFILTAADVAEIESTVYGAAVQV